MTTLNELMLESTNQFICSTPIRVGAAGAISLYEEQDVTQNSLAEFEENEKPAHASAAAANQEENPSVIKIESILHELRECFRYDPDKQVIAADEDSTFRDEELDQFDDDDDQDDKSRLRNEILKRVECERQIDELNKSLCEVKQQLSIALDSEKKRQIFARKMDSNLNKVLNEWKSKEADFEMRLKKHGQEKQELLKNQAKLLMVII